MITDNSLLLGIYSESDRCLTLEKSSSRIVKELSFCDENYILVEYRDTKTWCLYNNSKELSLDETVMIFSNQNLARLTNS